MSSIFGAHAKDLIFSGDDAADKQRRENFLAKYDEKNMLVREGNRTTLIIGKDDWPFPIPIVKKGETWVTVILENGFTGYIAGDTRIFSIQQVESIGNDLEMHESPDPESPILGVIPRKTVFTVRGSDKYEEDVWYRVQDSEGVEGYVKAGVKLRVRPEVSEAGGRKMMITGAVFAVIGLILYFLVPPAEAGSGRGDFSFITLALILLGLFQVFQGFMQYRQVNKKD